MSNKAAHKASASAMSNAPYSPLATPSATRSVLERHGLSTKKSLGQNFLVDDGVVGRICVLADIGHEDTILEVGPGIGTLTLALLPRAAHVLSVERDIHLPEVLAETCGSFDNFTLLSKDALNLSEQDLIDAFGAAAHVGTAPCKFVANLPYAVAATLVLDYFQRFKSIRSATVMVQSEVADRMMASPKVKSYGAYTVKLSLLARPVGRFQVSPNSFFPPPHVSSSVVRLDRRDGLGLSVQRAQRAAMMADAAFASRRKTIANSFKAYFSSRPSSGQVLPAVGDILAEAGIDARRRGESLDLDEFIALADAFERIVG